MNIDGIHLSKNIEFISNLLKSRYPLLSMDYLLKLYSENKTIANCVNNVLDYYCKYVGLDAFEKAIESFAKVSYDFIYYQARFMKTGKYINKSSESLKKNLYESEEKMFGYYLHGLFLTYALWPNHIKIYNYYSDEFLRRIKKLDSVLEVGVGHGLMALTLLRQLEKISYTGVDISQHALKFTNNILNNAKIDQSKFELQCADFTKKILEENSYSAGICCELLEHVENPSNILFSFRKNLNSKSPLFITTVINLSAEDHIYLFENKKQIHDLFNKCGYKIESERIFPLAQYCDRKFFCANYAAIIIPGN